LNGNVYIADSDKPIEVRFAESNKKKPSMPIAPIDMMPKPYTITPAMNPVTVDSYSHNIIKLEPSFLQIYVS
jgi:hypothetical protein